MTAERRWYRPREVADLLGIPSSTLRTYAANFGPLLSDEARPDGGDGRGFRHRRYDEDDLRILREAKDLVDAGMSYRAALARLGGAAFPRPNPRRRRPLRSRPRIASIAPVPATDPPGLEIPRSDSPPPFAAEPPHSVAVEGIDELRFEILSLRADLASARVADSEPEPSIELAMLNRLTSQVEEIQLRLERLEALLTALTMPTARPDWFGRLFRRT